MNNKNIMRFKAIFLLSTYLYMFSFFMPKFNKEDVNNTGIENSSFEPYTQYSNGNIYILDERIKNIPHVDNGDIYIIDSRDSRNPDMQICDSFKIKTKEEMIEILNIMLEYEEENPSKWDRTLNSMLNEWYIHNMCYYNYLCQSRTSCVDMDNNDENKYSLQFIDQFILKRK